MSKQKKQTQPEKDEDPLIASGAAESGYHPPSEQDIEDIKHDHNTAGPGATTADQAIREIRVDVEENPELMERDLNPKRESA